MAYLDFTTKLNGLNPSDLLPHMKGEREWFKRSPQKAQSLYDAVEKHVSMNRKGDFDVWAKDLNEAVFRSEQAESAKKLGVKFDDSVLKKSVEKGHKEASKLLEDITKAQSAFATQTQPLFDLVSEKVEEVHNSIEKIQREVKRVGSPISKATAEAALGGGTKGAAKLKDLEDLLSTYEKKTISAKGISATTIENFQSGLQGWRSDRMEAMTKLVREGTEDFNKRSEAVKKALTTIEEKSGIAFKGSAELANAASAVVKEGGKTVNTMISAEETAKGVIGKAAYETQGKMGKAISAATANLKTGGFTTARSAIGLVAVPALGYIAATEAGKALGMVDPGRDEAGNPVDTSGSGMKALLATAGVAAALALAVKGGGIRAKGSRA